MINTNYSNKNNYSPNFTSIRVVKATPKQFEDFTNNFKDFCSSNCVFRGESFYHKFFYESLIKIAERKKLSKDWIMQNAERFGLIDSKKYAALPIQVFTKKDVKKLGLFTLKTFLKNLFKKSKGVEKEFYVSEDFPPHLTGALALKRLADSKMPEYQKFLEKHNAKFVDYDEFINEVKSGMLDK